MSCDFHQAMIATPDMFVFSRTFCGVDGTEPDSVGRSRGGRLSAKQENSITYRPYE